MPVRASPPQHLRPKPQAPRRTVSSPSSSIQPLVTRNAAVDLVTETDQAVEKLISSALHEKYPSFSFMGEETYKPGDRLTSAPTFICDPIDGTTNFVHRHPHVAISLGLAVDLRPVVGVVYNPFTDTLYSAIAGQGAFLNQSQKLPLAPATPLDTLNSCLVAVEWGSDRSGNDFAVKSKTFANLAATKENGGGMVHGLRSLGSAALNLCAVASGNMDVYWEAGCWAWVRIPEPSPPDPFANLFSRMYAPGGSFWRKPAASWPMRTLETGSPASTSGDTWLSAAVTGRKLL